MGPQESHFSIIDGAIHDLPTAPSSPTVGVEYFDTVTNSWMRWNGVNWMGIALVQTSTTSTSTTTTSTSTTTTTTTSTSTTTTTTSTSTTSTSSSTSTTTTV